MEAHTLDEYARVLIGQNNNIPCPHCKSALGHYSFCGLINRETSEAQRAAEAGNISKEDAVRLRALGVIWES